MSAPPQNTVILYFPDTGQHNFKPPYELLFQHQALKGLNLNIVLVDKRTANICAIAEKYGKSLMALVVSTIIKSTSISIANQYKDGLEVSEEIGTKYGIPVIWTGILPTVAAENLIHKPFINYVIKGQSEKVLSNLLEALMLKKEPADSASIRKIADDKYIIDCDSVNYNSFETYGNFELSQIDTKAYIHKNIFDYIVSTGCVNACSFCTVPLVYGGKWQHNSIENIVNHLTYLLAKHEDIRTLHFRDDNFLVNKSFVFTLFESLYEKGLEFYWSAQSSINVLKKYSDEDLALLKKYGCNNISIGIESGDPFVLENTAPAKTDTNVGINILKRFLKAGITPAVTSIVGFPYHKLRDINKTLRLLMRLKLLYPNLSLYCTVFQPIPGTKAFGQILPEHKEQSDLKDFNTWTTHKHRVLLKKFEQVYFPFCNKHFYKSLSPEIAKKVKFINLFLYPFIRLRFFFATTSFLWEYALAAPYLKKLQKEGLWSDMNELKGIRHHNTNYDYGYKPKN